MLNSTYDIFNKATVLDDDDTNFNVTNTDLPTSIPSQTSPLSAFEQTLDLVSPSTNGQPSTTGHALPDTIVQHQTQTLNLRRSSRPHIIPTYMKEYNYSLPSLHTQPSSTPSFHFAPTTHFCSLTSLKQDRQHSVKSFFHDTEP